LFLYLNNKLEQLVLDYKISLSILSDKWNAVILVLLALIFLDTLKEYFGIFFQEQSKVEFNVCAFFRVFDDQAIC
jgi:hypothetical protein